MLTGSLVQNGSTYSYNGSIAPTQIAFPIFSYPVGPVVLAVDSGVSLQGNLSASVAPDVSLLASSQVTGDLQANLTAAAYVEGYAQFLFMKAGIGGQVDAISGTTGAHFNMTLAQALAGTQPQLQGFGRVSLLGGNVYGYLGSMKMSFYKWSGKCYSFDPSVSCAQ